METTFMVVKPRAVAEGLAGRILTLIEEAGFTVLGVASRRLTGEEAAFLYDVHLGRPFFESLVNYMTSGLSIGVLLEAPDAVAALRSLVGATDPPEAAHGTVRALFGLDKQRNAVHASDSPERVAHESGVYFGDCRRAMVRESC